LAFINKITHIIKRDGSLVEFDREKMVTGIYKAAASVGGHNRPLSEKLADEAIEMLNHNFPPPDVPTVEEIQDIVEKVLIENGHARTRRLTSSTGRQTARAGAQVGEAGQGKPAALPCDVRDPGLEHRPRCETTAKLNQRMTDGSFPDLIREADRAYDENVTGAAEAIASEGGGIRLIIVAGPSSSGKTTTTSKICARLRDHGVDTVLLNLDHYFFDLELHPKDEHGDYDFETPEALDIP